VYPHKRANTRVDFFARFCVDGCTMSHADTGLVDILIVFTSFALPFLAGAFILWPYLLRENAGSIARPRQQVCTARLTPTSGRQVT
jgi:hypothetical protein